LFTFPPKAIIAITTKPVRHHSKQQFIKAIPTTLHEILIVKAELVCNEKCHEQENDHLSLKPLNFVMTVKIEKGMLQSKSRFAIKIFLKSNALAFDFPNVTVIGIKKGELRFLKSLLLEGQCRDQWLVISEDRSKRFAESIPMRNAGIPFSKLHRRKGRRPHLSYKSLI